MIIRKDVVDAAAAALFAEEADVTENDTEESADMTCECGGGEDDRRMHFSRD